MGYNKQFAIAVPLSTDYASAGQQLVDGQLYSIQLDFDGSTCEFSAQLFVSSDPYTTEVGYVPTHLDPLADSTESFTEAGTFSYNVSVAGYNWVVLVITDASSGANDGTINARINVKN